MSEIIKLEGVSFSYSDSEDDKKIGIFKDLDLSIEKGSFVAILGHNGSGKSTLSRLLNGMIVPDSGTVTVNGLSTADEKNQLEIRKTVGLVFQNPDNQIVSTIVEEDVAFGPENLGVEEGGNSLPCGEIAEGGGNVRISPPRHNKAFGRTETENSHCGNTCHESRVPCARRGNRHA